MIFTSFKNETERSRGSAREAGELKVLTATAAKLEHLVDHTEYPAGEPEGGRNAVQ